MGGEHHHPAAIPQDVVEPHPGHDAEEAHEDDEPGPDVEESAGRVDVRDPREASFSGFRDQRLHSA